MLRPLLPEETFKKIILTGEANHPEITSELLLFCSENNESLSQDSYDEDVVKEDEEIHEMEEGSRMTDRQIG